VLYEDIRKLHILTDSLHSVLFQTSFLYLNCYNTTASRLYFFRTHAFWISLTLCNLLTTQLNVRNKVSFNSVFLHFNSVKIPVFST